MHTEANNAPGELIHHHHHPVGFECQGFAAKQIGMEACLETGRPTGGKSILKGVHNLRHTFGKRLRSAGIPLETRKALLGHANGDITTHYSAAELQELISATESIVGRGRQETPNLMLIGRKTEDTVGKVSETKKGLTGKIG